MTSPGAPDCPHSEACMHMAQLPHKRTPAGYKLVVAGGALVLTDRYSRSEVCWCRGKCDRGSACRYLHNLSAHTQSLGSLSTDAGGALFHCSPGWICLRSHPE